MTADIVIREAAGSDLAVILRHRRAMFKAMGYDDPAALDLMERHSQSYLRDGLANGTYRGWLAERRAGQVVAGGGIGLITWPAVPRSPQPLRPIIYNVYTDSDYRRLGLARRLMQVMIEWCRREGYQTIYLHASPQGRPLYVALGFEPTNEMHLTL